MEVPFYYSFKEFKDNYETDLKKWLEIYTEGNEKDFLESINNVYSEYYNYTWIEGYTAEFSEITKLVRKKYAPEKFDTNDYYDENGNYCEYTHIRDIINELGQRILTADLSSEKNLNEINDWEGLARILRKYGLLDDEINSQYVGVYNFIDINLIIGLECFWSFEISDNKKYWCLKFNEIKYQNFKLSIPKIYNFIQEKLNPKKTLENPKTPPPDEIEPITLPENIKTTKTNVIRLLHYTGILEFLRTKYPRMNESNLASFFELITKTPITHKNQNKHFYKNTDDSMYHKQDLDLILSKYNMIANDKEK